MSRGPRASARQEVYDALRRRIVTLDLLPGSALSENELAADHSVSRTPIREALVLLVDEGLVQVFPRVGSFVSRISLGDVAEAQFLRASVELGSLASLRYPLDPAVVDAIEENLRRQETVLDDVAAFFTLDEGYHEGLMALGGHRASWRVVTRAKAHLDRARALGLRDISSTDQLLGDHRHVFDRVLAHDLAGAQERLTQHLALVFTEMAEVYARSPHLFVSPGDEPPVRRSVAVWGQASERVPASRVG